MTEFLINIEDAHELREYLYATGRIHRRENIKHQILAGGVSCRTVLVTRPSGEAWVLKQALPKLRVEMDWYSDPARIHREALGLEWLERLLPPGCVPGLVFEDQERHVLAMEAVPKPHHNWKTRLLRGQIESGYVAQFATMLGLLHRTSCLRRDELLPIFEDQTFFESLRLEPYYERSAAQVPEAAGFLQVLLEETRRRRSALVHGDYSPKNILLYLGRLILLDHEVIHFGDPAFDIGFATTHLLSKAHYLPEVRGKFRDGAKHFWRTYLDALRDAPCREGLEGRAVRHTLGCLLARVAGRSPLEYLDAVQRKRQQSVAVTLMSKVPETMPDLIDQVCDAWNRG